MITDIMRFFGECGTLYLRSQLSDIFCYFSRMMADDRVIVVMDDSGFFAVVTISMCDNATPFIDKDEWQFMEHNPYGKIAFIEHMSCRKFSKELSVLLHNIIIDKYPTAQFGMWKRFRLPKDKLFTLRRKSYVTQQY